MIAAESEFFYHHNMNFDWKINNIFLKNTWMYDTKHLLNSSPHEPILCSFVHQSFEIIHWINYIHTEAVYQWLAERVAASSWGRGERWSVTRTAPSQTAASRHSARETDRRVRVRLNSNWTPPDRGHHKLQYSLQYRASPLTCTQPVSFCCYNHNSIFLPGTVVQLQTTNHSFNQCWAISNTIFR